MQRTAYRLCKLERLTPSSQSTTATFRSLHSSAAERSSFQAICESSKNNSVIVSSNTDNPFLNLALENALLTHTDRSSHILLFYTNRPCVVIGRNQNPWLECNLKLVQQGIQGTPIDLVRRRSGGGAVFHDVGNLNFSLIVPNDKDFTRMKHAQMVTKALSNTPTSLEDSRAFDKLFVNDRHDIVMSLHDKLFKVSGSAFKLTRGRALHHGTLLHSSPNLGNISAYLRSAGKDNIHAKGVESVRSPVHNLFKGGDDSRDEVRSAITSSIANEFQSLYGPATEFDLPASTFETSIVQKDFVELLSDDWRFGQTPRFDFKGGNGDSDPFSMSVNHGIIEEASDQQLRGHSLIKFDRASMIKDAKLAALLGEVFPPVRSISNTEAKMTSHIIEQSKQAMIRKLDDSTVEVETSPNTIEQK